MRQQTKDIFGAIGGGLLGLSFLFLLFFFAIIFSMLLSGCSGGGSGGHDRSFAGVWQVKLIPSINTCGQSGVDPFSATWTVNQDDTNLVLDRSNGDTYNGLADLDGGGFSVFHSQVVVAGCNNGNDVNFTTEIDFIRGSDADDRAAVVLESENQCDRSLVVCNNGWTGTAVRVKQ